MQLVVESAGVAYGFSVVVPSPQSGRGGAAVGTDLTRTSVRRHEWTHEPLLRSHEGSVHAVHLAVESAGIAQVVARAVPAPQWCGDGTAVHTLTLFLQSEVVTPILSEMMRNSIRTVSML